MLYYYAFATFSLLQWAGQFIKLYYPLLKFQDMYKPPYNIQDFSITSLYTCLLGAAFFTLLSFIGIIAVLVICFCIIISLLIYLCCRITWRHFTQSQYIAISTILPIFRVIALSYLFLYLFIKLIHLAVTILASSYLLLQHLTLLNLLFSILHFLLYYKQLAKCFISSDLRIISFFIFEFSRLYISVH